MSRGPRVLLGLAGLALAGALPGCRDVPPHRELPVDAALDVGAASELPVDYGEDGMPMRRPCLQTPTGTALANGAYGRLDGYLVAIVPLGYHGCHGDTDHLHLQVAADGLIYDIAVNVGGDVHSQTLDRALFAPAWSEGWHSDASVFVEYTGLGIHSDTIPLPGTTALAQAMTDELGNANHISIYATGYGPDGAHLVHRNGGGRDGLIVSHPLAAEAHARAFSFTDQSF